MYKVIVEPEQGENGITQRDVGMFTCKRCGNMFPRVLGRAHYLIVREIELNRLRKEAEEFKEKARDLELAVQKLQKEKERSEESLRNEARRGAIESMKSQLEQIETHVNYLQAERDRLKTELAED